MSTTSLRDVRVERTACGPLNLLLSGSEAGVATTSTEVAFSAAELPAGLPAHFDAMDVAPAGAAPDAPGGTLYLLRADGKELPLRARSVHVHRDAGAVVARAVPPRRAPLLRRVLWTWLPAIVATRAGKWLVTTLRR